MAITVKDFNVCVEFAQNVHKNSFRRDGRSPRINHSLRVANNIILTTHRQRCVAILHDAIEDFPPSMKNTVADIETIMKSANIPSEVIVRVRALTHNDGESYVEYIRKIVNFCKLIDDFDCVKVKIADIDDNITDEPTEKQINKYRKALAILNTP